MSLELITSAISSLGFPIAVCIALFWHMNKQTEMHKEEIQKMTEALNNNTLAINRLEVKIGAAENADDTI